MFSTSFVCQGILWGEGDMHLCRGTPRHTGTCRGHRSTRSVISKVPSALVFETGSLIWPGTRWLGWTVWLTGPGNLLSRLPWSWDYKHMPQHLAFFFFNVHSVDQTQILSGKHFISWAISVALPRLLRCYIRDSHLDEKQPFTKSEQEPPSLHLLPRY